MHSSIYRRFKGQNVCVINSQWLKYAVSCQSFVVNDQIAQKSQLVKVDYRAYGADLSLEWLLCLSVCLSVCGHKHEQIEWIRNACSLFLKAQMKKAMYVHVPRKQQLYEELWKGKLLSPKYGTEPHLNFSVYLHAVGPMVSTHLFQIKHNLHPVFQCMGIVLYWALKVCELA